MKDIRLLSVVVVVVFHCALSSSTLKARVVMKGQKFFKNVIDGRIKFIQKDCESPVTIKGVIFGLTPGLHGFHVHTYGHLEGDCESSGHHFNPFKAKHGGPLDEERHVGDLGNVLAVYKRRLSTTQADINMTDNVISLCAGPTNIMNRTLVVHDNDDDLGRGSNLDSIHHGNSGIPVACGIIQPA